MKKSYYLFNPGHLERRDNTLKFTPHNAEGATGPPRFIPVESVEELYVFGDLDANSALYNFLGQQSIAVHFFNYYEQYSGSFMPRDYLLAGKVQVAQTRHYIENRKRLPIAATILEGASFNMLKVLRYYANRGQDLAAPVAQIETLRESVSACGSVSELMGIEGNIRKVYYEAFDVIIKDFDMAGRSKQPPKNEVNALISYGNMLCYAQCLKQIYHTQLNPAISFLHEPGARRYSLALDLAELFKPILVDRLIFSMFNKRMLQDSDFRWDLNHCLLKESGAKTFTKAWEERLNETIEHRALKRKVSYKRLIRMECHKLVKHLIGDLPYKPFKIYW
ncbi:MAG: type I-B CRISPR-associated endonuclease Cas1 [Saprospiraceae bacterium]|nr:type I-B CRISPR-associated endonuclease Cas1 [Saprospiraceae bacterium]